MNVAELRLKIQNLKVKEAETTDTLQSLIRTEPIKLISNLPSPQGLLAIIEKTDVVSKSISAKVRIMERQLTAAQELIEVLNNLKELEKNVTLLETSNLYSSCEIIQRTMSFLPSLGELAGDNLEKIAEFKDHYLTILEKQIDDCIANEDDSIYQSLRMFVMLNEHERGLNRLSSFLRLKIESQLRKRDDRDKPIVIQLASLYDTVATTITKKADETNEIFGKGNFVYVLKRMQNEIDVRTSILINQFVEKHQIEKKINIINKGSNDIDMVELDKVTNEMVGIVQKSIMFDRFIRSKVKTELEEIEKRKTVELPAEFYTELPAMTILNEKVHYLVSHLVVLLVSFLQKSIQKAKQMDKKEVNALITTAVDDSFFVTKVILERAFRVGNCDLTCALLNGVSRTLEESFIAPMLKSLSASFSKSGQIENTVTTLNNVDTCCIYVNELSNDTTNKIETVFFNSSALQKEQIKSCLTSLVEYSLKTKEILQTYMELYFQNIIKPKMKSVLHGFMEESYKIGEAEYTKFQRQESNRIPTVIQKEFGNLLDSTKTLFTENNYETLLQLTLNQFVVDLESKLMTFKFSLFGALKIDVQIRAVITKLSEKYKRVREAFQRISQTIMILNLESLDDFEEIYHFDGRLKLNGDEVRKILSLRIDFEGKLDSLTFK